jgi:predicted transcriptional regulator
MNRNTYVQFENFFFEKIIKNKRLEMFNLLKNAEGINPSSKKPIEEMDNLEKAALLRNRLRNEIKLRNVK